jgi:acyl-CoA synthetase (AMP-forming)/AMP-acid ligase II/glyoxylase-like metal-dependent hydrolase (beta-lactamase superfamily II)
MLHAMESGQRAASIGAVALAAARRFPDVEAIVDGSMRISYAQLGQEVVRSTRAAVKAGIEPGDRASIWAPNGHRWIIAALGVLGAGGVLVPLSTRFKGGEAAYVLGKAGARVLFTDNGFLGTDYPAMLRGWLAQARQALRELRDVVVLDGEAGPDTSWADYLTAGEQVSDGAARDRIGQVAGDDLSDILFTSGTTGRPKGAMCTHAQALRLYETWCPIVGLRERDRYLIVNPFFHSFGYKAGWLAAIMQGATVVPMAVFDVARLAELVQRERITFLPGPPTLLAELLRFGDRDRFDLSSLRTTVTGAADVPFELIRRLRSEMTFETIITGYGLTETNGPAAICRADDDPDTIASFCGAAIPGTELKITGPGGSELPHGESGEIVVRGYHVMVGYLDDPAGTAAAVDADGWLHTGDIGLMDDRGYLKVTGRMKDMYSVGGFNAYPAEIENVLLGNADVAQVAVVGVPDERLGEVGMAFVVPRAGGALTPGGLIGWARGRMANYKVPRYAEFCGDLPTNAIGKVAKDELRERGRARVAMEEAAWRARVAMQEAAWRARVAMQEKGSLVTLSKQRKVGDVTVTMVVERHNEMAAENFIPRAAGEALERHREWLHPWAVSDAGRLRFVMQALCLEIDGQKIIVDTCIGPRQLPEIYAGLENDGSFIDALTAAGFGRDDVDLVINTHLHFDHVGWNTFREDGEWVPTFRRARYLIARPEYEHWLATPEGERPASNVLNFKDTAVSLVRAGVADLVETDHRVSDAIRLVPTPGHTPGHVSVSVTSGGEAALVTGDCAHHAVQLAEPGCCSLADADPGMATATRQRLIREHADTGVLVIGSHFPPPGAGYLVTTDTGVRFQPAAA